MYKNININVHKYIITSMFFLNVFLKISFLRDISLGYQCLPIHASSCKDCDQIEVQLRRK